MAWLTTTQAMKRGVSRTALFRRLKSGSLVSQYREGRRFVWVEEGDGEPTAAINAELEELRRQVTVLRAALRCRDRRERRWDSLHQAAYLREIIDPEEDGLDRYARRGTLMAL